MLEVIIETHLKLLVTMDVLQLAHCFLLLHPQV